VVAVVASGGLASAAGRAGAEPVGGPDRATVVRPLAPRAATRRRASCPPAPKRPRRSRDYRLSGARWDPARPIDWVLVTAGTTDVAARIADWRRAFADARVDTGLQFHFAGTVAEADPTPPAFLVQIGYFAPPSLPVTGAFARLSSTFRPGPPRQLLDVSVSVVDTMRPGYGPFDIFDPAASPEGGVVLHEVGAVLGLDNLPASAPAAVMSPEIDLRHYFRGFQAGDDYGLWRVGAAAGCAGFVG
jgi:hypothetical protein